MAAGERDFAFGVAIPISTVCAGVIGKYRTPSVKDSPIIALVQAMPSPAAGILGAALILGGIVLPNLHMGQEQADAA